MEVTVWRWLLLSSVVCHVLDVLPHACWVPVGKVILNLLPVSSLGLLDASLEVVSGCAVLLSVPRSECCISDPQQSSDLLGHSSIPVWENLDAFVGGYVFSTGSDVAENSGGISLYIWVRAVLRLWRCIFRPGHNSLGGGLQFFNTGAVCWVQEEGQVVRLSKV